MKNTRFVVKVNRGGTRPLEYVRRIDRTPVQTTTNRKLALVMGRFTACAKKCLAAGAKIAFVPDGTEDVLIVDNPDKLKGHEGHHVAVTGHVDKDKKTVHVETVTMVAEAGGMKQ